MQQGRPMKCVLGPPISCCAAFCCVQELATGGIQLRSLHQTASSSGSTQRSQNRNDLPSLPSNPYQEFGINPKTKNMNTWLQQRRCLPGVPFGTSVQVPPGLRGGRGAGGHLAATRDGHSGPRT